MIDFRELYSNLSDQISGHQKKILVDSCLEVFFGFSKNGNLRLSFLSTITPPTIQSTTILHVVQGREKKDTYWTSFDLLNTELKEAYFSFCENMIESIIGIRNESIGLSLLKRRFITWKKLFQKNTGKDVPKERLMGAFGELTVLKDIIATKYGISTAIQAWGGPDMQSKDFTLSDTWYEVKTIGATTDSLHVSSLTQLSSDMDGHLVVVRVEAVSPEFGKKYSAVIDLINQILLLVSDENTENLFIRKVQGLGIDVFGNEINYRFDLKSIRSYFVGDDFPRITEKNIPYHEITDVNYVISAAAISRFEEE